MVCLFSYPITCVGTILGKGICRLIMWKKLKDEVVRKLPFFPEGGWKEFSLVLHTPLLRRILLAKEKQVLCLFSSSLFSNFVWSACDSRQNIILVYDLTFRYNWWHTPYMQRPHCSIGKRIFVRSSFSICNVFYTTSVGIPMNCSVSKKSYSRGYVLG